MARSKVKSRSDHDVAHLQPLTNIPTKYQLHTPYSFRDIAQTRFYRSRSLRQGQRSNQGQTMTLHNYTPQAMSLPNINLLPLTVSEIQPGQTFSSHPSARPPVLSAELKIKPFDVRIWFESQRTCYGKLSKL